MKLRKKLDYSGIFVISTYVALMLLSVFIPKCVKRNTHDMTVSDYAPARQSPAEIPRTTDPGLLISGDLTFSTPREPLDIRAGLSTANTIRISPGIEIDARTGNVSIPEGLSLDEASRAFWQAVQSMAPEIRQQIIDDYNQTLNKPAEQ